MELQHAPELDSLRPDQRWPTFLLFTQLECTYVQTNIALLVFAELLFAVPTFKAYYSTPFHNLQLKPVKTHHWQSLFLQRGRSTLTAPNWIIKFRFSLKKKKKLIMTIVWPWSRIFWGMSKTRFFNVFQTGTWEEFPLWISNSNSSPKGTTFYLKKNRYNYRGDFPLNLSSSCFLLPIPDKNQIAQRVPLGEWRRHKYNFLYILRVYFITWNNNHPPRMLIHQ